MKLPIKLLGTINALALTVPRRYASYGSIAGNAQDRASISVRIASYRSEQTARTAALQPVQGEIT